MKKTGMEIIISGVVLDETTTFTLTEVTQQYDLSEVLLQEMFEFGLIQPIQRSSGDLLLDLQALQRAQTARRLQKDLDINLAGAALVLDLLDELERARDELVMLRKHLAEK